MRKFLLGLVLFVASTSVSASTPVSTAQQSAPLVIGRVTVNQTHIAFQYAGDIWKVDRAGGDAERMTSDPAEDGYPIYSPDGSQLAFSRQLGGAWKLFIMPAAGGEARQLTYIPEDDLAMGWTPDGKNILFQSHRDEEGAFRLYTIATDGVMPSALPLPQAFAGSFSPDGSRIAYTPMTSFGDWRFYRGGMESPIWIAGVRDGVLEKLPSGDYNDRNPMWVENKIYFFSDRTGTFNLFVYDQTSKQTKQLTSYERHGIRAASAGAGAVVFVQAGRVHIFDLGNNQDRVVDLRVNTADSPELKPRTVNARGNIDWATLSSSGDRLFINARGEVLSFDPKSGDSVNVTKTSGVAERYPNLSPDDKWLAYFSDESGEYQLHVRQANGEGRVKKITIEAKPTFYRELTWSPDSKKLAFTDKRLSLWIADVERGTAKRVDTSPYSYQEEWNPRWSPDSRWLVYSRHLHNRVRTIFLHQVEAGTNHQVTDGRTDARWPVFDQGGKYLYFVSSPNAGTSEFGWGVLNGEFTRPLVTRKIYALVLQNDAVSPLLPNGQPNPDVKIDEIAAPMRIDLENLGRRVFELPLAGRDYSELIADKPGLLYIVVAEWPKSPSPGSFPSVAMYRYDLSKPPKFERMLEEIEAYELSRDGKRLLYLRGREWFLASAEQPPRADDGKLDMKKLEVSVDPSAEWAQMYRESWRIMRDWFYDPNYHGQNLAQLDKDYAAYLPGITRRADLNNLLRQMLGHISVSHLGVGGGDTPPPPGGPSRIGLLGADYEIDQGRYRFKRIYRSFSYDSPSGTATAPLDRPGVNVREGEYLLEVDGQKIDASKNIYTYFDGKVSRPVKLTVGPNADGSSSRTITVFPTNGENFLRRVNWAERNRRRVEELSGGKLGYIYVEGYGQGVMDFIRGLTGYSDKQGIIIDQRYNGGGITPDYLIEWLTRKPIYYYNFREGDDIATPVNPGPQTKVLLINEHNGSAAETFAFMYKLGKVGPIVGWRTYGAGIGPYVFTPRLIDGGRIQLPNRAAYNPDGTSWGIENAGVKPDFSVEITPRDWMAGRDPQLEKAVQVAMDEMKRKPVIVPKRPKYPVHP
jgi:tricorn protease